MKSVHNKIARTVTYNVIIKEIEAKTILRKHKKIDSWFISHYGMNLYRGCQHNCVYCDGRSEGYYVEGDFGADVTVKTNALDVLRRELDPKRKRTPFKHSYIMVGGGVGDSYQPVEKKYELTRKTLQLLSEKKLPVHILTKSTLVKRDIDLLKKINEETRTIVSFSFSSTNKKISSIFEPGVPPPEERLRVISFLHDEGIPCGMFLLPVIPFITDTNDILEETIKTAYEISVDFIIFGGMTLKEGRQKDYFSNVLQHHYPHLLSEYQMIYRGDKWGQATPNYYDSIHQTFNYLTKKYRIPKRIPPSLFTDVLSTDDLVIVILEHLDYLLKLEGKKTPYGYAAYQISQLQEPLSTKENELEKIKGAGPTTQKIVSEILKTRKSTYYEQLITG
ncbi:MAG: radical SAM protein [Methanobacteriota archaeon]